MQKELSLYDSKAGDEHISSGSDPQCVRNTFKLSGKENIKPWYICLLLLMYSRIVKLFEIIGHCNFTCSMLFSSFIERTYGVEIFFSNSVV